MLIHWVWLSQLSKFHNREKLALLRQFGDPEALYCADDTLLARLHLREEQNRELSRKDLAPAENILAQCSDKRIGVLTYGDSSYPQRLKALADPPLVLYYRGMLPDWQGRPYIGIVGTRKATGWGLNAAENFGYQITGCGANVVSGGADGIDTRALQGALKAGGAPVAVLGFGADVVYPKANKALFEEITQKGCLLTEFIPGTPPYRWNFPSRNRIISGLSSGILVVEAPEKSGALNTARHAWEQGRDVFAAPGSVGADYCAGSNGLLRDGAIPALQGWDAVKEYEALYPGKLRVFRGNTPPNTGEKPIPAPEAQRPPVKKSVDNREKPGYSVLNNELPQLTEEEMAVYRCLTQEPVAVDFVIETLQKPAGKVLSTLTVLAMKGLVQNHPGKRVSKK